MTEMKEVAILVEALQAALAGEPASSKDGDYIVRFSGALRVVSTDPEKTLALGQCALGLLIERQRAALIVDQTIGKVGGV